ncbi:carboxypeptidase-like regulatory domain-containing protein [Panacibacter ginsenosidivorans]|uniref:Carboxypeptidase-like regulatory domain-containing protein n=1 Tax=Panacibacter ginsenosidivorans TaxID=1813871 RepID=A0A5B8V773_9BACT|nr:carboxypeptidase-like regulatory domain-containing protein [Panacibacter ginsenosidivorans]QEC66753.1 carboxypeptidase-like regulatory domain-containing protein [Panacibacter ginsenosidivorans]
MQKICCCVIACILITSTVYSQTLLLKGKVLDAASGKPVAGASVFLSNTSYGSVSNSAGVFEITGIRQGNYDLIVSYVGYETYSNSISLNASKEGLAINIKQKVAELKEVIVRNYQKDGWQKWGSFFIENFIGTSALAQQCVLKNKDVLKFSYSKKDDELNVDATEPILIENKALGYTIQYQLENFVYDFERKSLFFAGYPLFIEMQGGASKKKKWEKARADAYEVSSMRFMRSLYRNRLTEDGYQLLLLERIPNLEKQRLQAKEKFYYDTVRHKNFVVSFESTLQPDSLDHYKKVMAQKDPIEIIHPGLLKGEDIAYGADSITAALDFKQYLIVRFPQRTIPQEYAAIIPQGSTKQPVSSIISLINQVPVYVTSNGYYYNVTDMEMEGFWGWWEKISSLLPYDYMPSKNN